MGTFNMASTAGERKALAAAKRHRERILDRLDNKKQYPRYLEDTALNKCLKKTYSIPAMPTQKLFARINRVR